jgi:hypothetical protein
MKEHPILFKTPMVRAILDGAKTETRRPAKNNSLPYGPGDLLWVRETWAKNEKGEIVFKADTPDYPTKWKSPIFLFKQDARIWLRVLAVKLHYLCEIKESDAREEGFGNGQEFIDYWDKMYAKKPEYQSMNSPLVWVVRFEWVDHDR